jgi:hypothetical protein
VQALSGFLFVVTCDGEVFYASHTVEQYLGFHQVTFTVRNISEYDLVMHGLRVASELHAISSTLSDSSFLAMLFGRCFKKEQH